MLVEFLPWQGTLSRAALLLDVLLEHVLETQKQSCDRQAAGHAPLLLGGQTGGGLVVVQQWELQQRLKANFGKLLSQLSLAVVICFQDTVWVLQVKKWVWKRTGGWSVSGRVDWAFVEQHHHFQNEFLGDGVRVGQHLVPQLLDHLAVHCLVSLDFFQASTWRWGTEKIAFITIRVLLNFQGLYLKGKPAKKKHKILTFFWLSCHLFFK